MMKSKVYLGIMFFQDSDHCTGYLDGISFLDVADNSSDFSGTSDQRVEMKSHT